MEVIYPRDTRKDGLDSGIIGETNIVNDNSLNQTFYEYLTKYFNDNSRSIIETVYNTYNELPNVGVNELLFAYLQRIETELKNIRETSVQNTDRIVEKLLEIHSVVDLGEYTWNDFTEHIFMLTGGVSNSITINQFIANICAVVQVGSEFQTVDAATGLKSISLYDAQYIQQLIDSGGVLDIGADKFVLLTACEIQINDNDLGGQLGDDTQTEDPTVGQDSTRDVYLYNTWAMNDSRKISSSDDWSLADVASVFEGIQTYVGGSAVAGLKLKGNDPDFFPDGGFGTNEFNFNWLPSGKRTVTTGSFAYSTIEGWITGIGSMRERYTWKMETALDSTSTGMQSSGSYGEGLPIVFVKATSDPDGTITQYVGNNGEIHRAVAINGYFVTEYIRETLYRDGSPIFGSEHTDSEWVSIAASHTPAYCINKIPFFDASYGAVAGVSDDGSLSVFNLGFDGFLKQPRKIFDIDRKTLIPVFMRKIT